MDEESNKKLEAILREGYTESYWKGVKYGGEYVIKVLKDAMNVSGLDHIPALWLETAIKELQKIDQGMKK